jgi:excisionase family DNA binding protein
MSQESQLITATQVAKRLQVSPETARQWGRTGKVRMIELPGGQYRFDADEIEAIARGEKPAGVSR